MSGIKIDWWVFWEEWNKALDKNYMNTTLMVKFIRDKWLKIGATLPYSWRLKGVIEKKYLQVLKELGINIDKIKK